MLISCLLLLLANLPAFSTACSSQCHCYENLVLCLSTSASKSAELASDQKVLTTIRDQMREIGVISLEFYADYEPTTETRCDSHSMTAVLQDCCSRNASGGNVSRTAYQLEKACLRITYNFSQNGRFDSWPLNRSLAELVQLFNGLQVESENEAGHVSISTVVALLVPACVSILVLPFAILAVCCCCRSCKKKRKTEKRGMKSIDKVQQCFNPHYMSAKKSIATIVSNSTTGTMLDITAHSTIHSADTPVPAIVIPIPFGDRPKMQPSTRKQGSMTRHRSSSTPDLRSMESAEWQNLTLSRIAALRGLQRAAYRSTSSSGSIGDDGLKIMNWWESGEVPDEFYAVFVHPERPSGSTDSESEEQRSGLDDQGHADPCRSPYGKLLV